MANKRMKLASRGQRFLAAVIDWIAPLILLGILVIAVPGASRFLGQYFSRNYLFGLDNDIDIDDDFYYDYYYSTDPNRLYAGLGVSIVILILLVVYTVVQIYFYSRSQSIGKAVIGLKVVSSKNGKPMGIWWMLLREIIVKQACSSVFYLGYIWILIDDKNRGWHDKILDTYVIDLKETDRLNDNKPEVTVVNPKPVQPAPTPVEMTQVSDEKESTVVEEDVINVTPVDVAIAESVEDAESLETAEPVTEVVDVDAEVASTESDDKEQ